MNAATAPRVERILLSPFNILLLVFPTCLATNWHSRWPQKWLPVEQRLFSLRRDKWFPYYNENGIHKVIQDFPLPTKLYLNLGHDV